MFLGEEMGPDEKKTDGGKWAEDIDRLFEEDDQYEYEEEEE